MEITQSVLNDELILFLRGKLFSPTAPLLENAIEKALQSSNCIVIDFKEVSFLASSGLRVLLAAEKKVREKDGKLTIRNPSELVKKVFVLTGFSNILNIE